MELQCNLAVAFLGIYTKFEVIHELSCLKQHYSSESKTEKQTKIPINKLLNKEREI